MTGRTVGTCPKCGGNSTNNRTGAGNAVPAESTTTCDDCVDEIVAAMDFTQMSGL